MKSYDDEISVMFSCVNEGAFQRMGESFGSGVHSHSYVQPSAEFGSAAEALASGGKTGGPKSNMYTYLTINDIRSNKLKNF